ncbi:MAG TPA: biosynthetic-type acetolactate synthase large subunit [Candidatus Limnocylindrales bacterium]|nr:biosynthetic-type acetolactate synthase large subunit [Candidatus Limnocylindrales bacterium]
MNKAYGTQTGAEMLVRTLESLGVTHIFGYSGGAVIPMFDALVTTKTKIKLVAVRHEQGAVHMADGYARATGKPGVVLVTSGPGAGNTISGIMTAQMDSVPLLVISGQQISNMLGYDAFQETDVINLTLPLVKHSYQIFEPADITRITIEAYKIAQAGRPGPVVIDIPKDVSSAIVPQIPEQHPVLSEPASGKKLPNKNLTDIAAAVEVAEKPLLLVGQGVIIADAAAELQEFVAANNIPVVTTLLGKGAIDETSDMSLGMLGMHGTAAANYAVQETDCLLVIGSRFDDRIVGDPEVFASQATICHIDIDRSEIGKMVRPHVHAVDDAKEALILLRQAVKPRQRSSWLKRVRSLKLLQPADADHTSDALTQQHVLQTLDRLTSGQAIYTTDVGQHQMWAAQFCRVTQPRHWLTSGGAGTMGFGFPAAIGAQFAFPHKTVVSISGDGGFQMTQFELATAAIHKLPLKILILDNHYLGMVRQWQEMFYDNRESGVTLEGNPDFALLAQAYGIKALHITKPGEVEEQLSSALAYRDGPVVIWCEVAKTDNVYPMIPAGRPYSHMLLAPPTEALDKPIGST